jgi:hypothetical protein
MPPILAGWAASLELSGLPDETAAMAHSYLTRFWQLTPPARNEFGRRIAAEVASRVSPPPPPGTPPAAYLSAVVAERRAREMARMAARAKQAGAAALEPAPPALQPASAPDREGRPGGPGDGPAPAAGGFAPPA